jgi:hypothetical protein
MPQGDETRFTFSGWLKIAGGATVRIGVRSGGGAEAHQEMAEGKWRLLTVDFTTEANSPAWCRRSLPVVAAQRSNSP